MKLGTGLFTAQLRPDDDRSMDDVYDEILTLTREAEAAGLDSAWVSEHHFQRDGYLSAPFTTLGAMAAESSSMEIGTCIALAPLYDPVRLAEDAATLDLLSGGRATLGLAIGSNPREFEQFGIPSDERVERLEDTLGLLQAAWSEGPLDYDARFHDVEADVTVTPKPERRLTMPTGESQQSLPVMLGGAAKPAVRRAARTADAWCAPSKLSVEGLRKRAADIRRVREAEGLDGDFSIYLIRHGFVGESREAAWETMKPGYFYIQRRYAEIFAGEPVDSLDAERKRELREEALVGTPEEVVADLETYRDALAPIVDDLGGDLHVILRMYHPGIGTDAMTAAIRLLGDAVAPKVR